MRAASGLHQLVLAAFAGGALVATSANRSGEPIARDADEDSALLTQLADGVLRHDLPIVNRIDDSVLRLAAGRPLVLRLGRGLAPLTVAHVAPRLGPGQNARDASDARGAGLALGAQLKGSVALQLPQQILLSPDLGDISSSLGSRHLQETASHWLQRHGVTAATIACDAHPGYSSSQLAADLASQQGLPLRAVQHHHAHGPHLRRGREVHAVRMGRQQVRGGGGHFVGHRPHRFGCVRQEIGQLKRAGNLPAW
jgi:hydrogenase maturation protein HypF